MSIWIVIWVLVSAALIYFSAWTLWILLKQKTAWSNFAKQHKLRYTAPVFYNSPEMSGLYQGYSISLFPCQHATPDARSARKLTGVEVSLKSAMPVAGVMGSGGMVTVIEHLNFRDEIRPDYSWWNEAQIIRTENKTILEPYLTEERLKAFGALAKIRNAWVIFIFKDGQTILRVDTPDPLDSEKKIAAILNRMVEAAKILELHQGEADRLSAARPKTEKKILPLKDETVAPGLELEDDSEDADKQADEATD